MKIECTVEELKELLKKETPVAETTDVNMDGIFDYINKKLGEKF